MAKTLTSLHYHIIFGTNLREPWITRDQEERLRACLGGIVRFSGMVDATRPGLYVRKAGLDDSGGPVGAIGGGWG